MSEILLSEPELRYQASFIAAMKEMMDEGQPPDWNLQALREHFDEYLEVLRARVEDPLPGLVPSSEYWLIVDGEYAGRLSLRHFLNEKLEFYGGHIGYDIRPSMRRRGLGTLQCALGLQKARALGLRRVLITCDDNNEGSIRIIERNGGVLQDKVDNGRGVLTRRYWIELDAPEEE